MPSARSVLMSTRALLPQPARPLRSQTRRHPTATLMEAIAPRLLGAQRYRIRTRDPTVSMSRRMCHRRMATATTGPLLPFRLSRRRMAMAIMDPRLCLMYRPRLHDQAAITDLYQAATTQTATTITTTAQHPHQHLRAPTATADPAVATSIASHPLRHQQQRNTPTTAVMRAMAPLRSRSTASPRPRPRSRARFLFLHSWGRRASPR